MKAASHEEWLAGIESESNSVFPIRAGFMPSSQPLEEFPWPFYLVVKFLAPVSLSRCECQQGGGLIQREVALCLSPQIQNKTKKFPFS